MWEIWETWEIGEIWETWEIGEIWETWEMGELWELWGKWQVSQVLIKKIKLFIKGLDFIWGARFEQKL